jgi:hypothetical protein
MKAAASICAFVLLGFGAPAGAANLDFDARSACPSIYQPVCAGKAGETQTFGNACLAQRDGFAVIRKGGCDGSAGLPRFCAKEYRPVCGAKGGDRRTFGSACEARVEEFAVLHEGSC